LRGYAGHIHSHVYNRGILQTREQGCKFLLQRKAVSQTTWNLPPIGCGNLLCRTKCRRYSLREVTGPERICL
jgi:hypothetical protein